MFTRSMTTRFPKSYSQYALDYGVSKRTIVNWANQDLPLDEPLKLLAAIGRRKNVPPKLRAMLGRLAMMPVKISKKAPYTHKMKSTGTTP